MLRPFPNWPSGCGPESGEPGPLRSGYAGKVAGGQAFNQPVSGLDIMPTVVRAAGFTLPSERANDGRDMLAALDGKRAPR